MKNVNVKSENSKLENLNLEKLNFENFKSKKDLKVEKIEKEENTLNAGKSASLYKGMDNLSSDEKKKKRSFIRRKVEFYYRSLFIKGYNTKDEKELIIEFLEFYRDHWKIQDFKIDSFTNQKNEIDKKNYAKLLKVAESFLKDNS